MIVRGVGGLVAIVAVPQLAEMIPEDFLGYGLTGIMFGLVWVLANLLQKAVDRRTGNGIDGTLSRIDASLQATSTLLVTLTERLQEHKSSTKDGLSEMNDHLQDIRETLARMKRSRHGRKR